MFLTICTGNSGQPIPLKTNYFNLEQAPDWHLYQYHVGFNPELDSKKLRIALLYHHEELLGKTRAFDGMTLYLPHKLQNVVGWLFKSLWWNNLDFERVLMILEVLGYVMYIDIAVRECIVPQLFNFLVLKCSIVREII